MSELSVGSLAGLAANSFVIDVASGSQLTQPGMVLQVVSTTKTDTFSSSSSTFTDITGLSATITPSSTSSEIIVLVSLGLVDANDIERIAFQVERNGTPVNVGDAAGSRTRGNGSFTATAAAREIPIALTIVDSPSSTSSLTYQVQAGDITTGTFFVNRNSPDTDSSTILRGSSTITLMEVAG